MRRVKLYPDYCTNWMVMTIAEYGVVYCLFCSTGKEEQVVRLIQEYGWGRAIFAYRIKTMLKKGAWIKAPAPLLPGYVFLYMDVTRGRFDDILRLQHVIRLLTYNDGTSALIGHDLEFADLLWRLDGQIDVMKAVQIGDRIEIIDGVFKQLHGTITRMDRRRKTICVSLETEGALRQIWLAYEIVEKVAEHNAALIADVDDKAGSST